MLPWVRVTDGGILIGATNSTGGPCANAGGSSDFIIGVGIALIGSTIIPLGMNLQRMAHLQIAAKGGEQHVCCNKLWMMGLVVFGLGNAGDAMALAFAPQSVITPVDGWSLRCTLEPATRRAALH